MTKKINVWVGDGTTIDGGPFAASEILSHDEDSMQVSFNCGADEGEMPRHNVNAAVDDLESGEPVSFNHLPPEDEGFMRVNIPIIEWLLFETDGQVATGEELLASGDLRRQFSRSFRNHGGAVHLNY